MPPGRAQGSLVGPLWVSGLCQPRASLLVVTSRRMSLRAGEMPARFGATTSHPHLQQDGQEGQLCPHVRLQGSLSARYRHRCHRRHTQGSPRFPAWPKLGGERSGCKGRVQSTQVVTGVSEGGGCLRRGLTAGCRSVGWVPGAGHHPFMAQLCLSASPRQSIAGTGRPLQHPPAPIPPSHRVRQQLHGELWDPRPAAGWPAETCQQQPAVPR